MDIGSNILGPLLMQKWGEALHFSVKDLTYVTINLAKSSEKMNCRIGDPEPQTVNGPPFCLAR